MLSCFREVGANWEEISLRLKTKYSHCNIGTPTKSNVTSYVYSADWWTTSIIPFGNKGNISTSKTSEQPYKPTNVANLSLRKGLFP